MLDNIDKILQKIRFLFEKYKVIIIIMIIVLIAIFLINELKNDTGINNVKEYYENEIEKKNKDEKIENNEIAVYIAGEINNPGIYYTKENSRVDDIIKLAGGITIEANIDNINLAKKVTDGEKIYIYKIGEEIRQEELLYDIQKENNKININTANVNELTKLTGIGNATAKKIIEYRQKNGNFDTIEDIKKVSGIGNSKFESIKNDICV